MAWYVHGTFMSRTGGLLTMRDPRFQGKHARSCLLLPLFVSLAVAGQPAEAPKALPAKTVVRGTVVDDKGKPVAGASVRGVALWTGRQGSTTLRGVLPSPELKT